MFNSLTYLDLSVLLGRGFTFGITDEVLWGKDKDGEEWQVLVNPTFLTFAKFDKQTRRTEGNHEKMSHTEFNERFR